MVTSCKLQPRPPSGTKEILVSNHADFDHDHLGHLLMDKRLAVPNFQRPYSWDHNNIEEFWEDLQRARESGSYFMGTIVLANDASNQSRQLVIDGQQRITTAAILFVAIRNRLNDLGKTQAASDVGSKHLADYILVEERSELKLSLGPDDEVAYRKLVEEEDDISIGAIYDSYVQLKEYVDRLAPSKDDYKNLIALTSFLDSGVQVLLAIAPGLSEAYVIFETLNDRGADLTTADLLKNYLFSSAGSDSIDYVQAVWTRVNSRFEKSDDFVKFLRHEYMSRHGRVTSRGLYKALQADIGRSPREVRRYLEGVEDALTRYLAFKEPDSSYWSSIPEDVRDSLLAFRRFQFESSMPLLLSAFSNWKQINAVRFVDRVAAWSIRAWVVDNIGGGAAETAFCDAAVAVSKGDAKSVEDVYGYLRNIVPDDVEFKQALKGLGSISTTRAKYILAMIERVYRIECGESIEAAPDWSSKSVTVEHIMAKSLGRSRFDNDGDFEEFKGIRNRLQNYTLLERALNSSLEDKSFIEKRSAYSESKFRITKRVALYEGWTIRDSKSYGDWLADMAAKAWPVK